MQDKRALTQWEKSEISYQNYSHYIESKPLKFDLSIIDLFYIKNFKGGSATINEREKIVSKKLTSYSEILKKIDSEFNGKNLNELTDPELSNLINLAKEGLGLVKPKSNTKIDGFSFSFLTTLLHFHFPKLLPILDRRVLNGLKMLKESDLDTQKQVKNLESFYPELIKAFKQKTSDKTIRELDKELFTIKFN
ncbi:MAG: hypothetical protein HRT67_06260 [Flavobacteriaceae bacterium]|nr:hypothetical protein [Flavobacteriaceae bacterium]